MCIKEPQIQDVDFYDDMSTRKPQFPFLEDFKADVNNHLCCYLLGNK